MSMHDRCGNKRLSSVLALLVSSTLPFLFQVRVTPSTPPNFLLHNFSLSPHQPLLGR
ncbi:hypothetical protein AOQ84DRAFT_354879 [Glonium stellatum]|uniref:Uncharacterized protein n=1 Tax=Glonium stellatum TaxID=574774 RepID=A0A8E2EZB5_9PEZI|nr:hypothetical protein AOQ84DRAFT_354879 [Glonium stellatum]